MTFPCHRHLHLRIRPFSLSTEAGGANDEPTIRDGAVLGDFSIIRERPGDLGSPTLEVKLHGG